ncbi:MAG: hypothetical protein ACRD0P_12990 [Stackebrandtia sp.]
MPELDERTRTAAVTVTSPDRNIRATLRGRSDVTLEFRTRAYRNYTEMALAGQLTRLANAMTEDCRHHRRQHTGTHFNEGPRWDARARRFHEVRDRVEVSGRSLDGRLLIECVGLQSWRVHVARGTVGNLSEVDFTAQAQWAVKNLWWQYRRELKSLYTKQRALSR